MNRRDALARLAAAGAGAVFPGLGRTAAASAPAAIPDWVPAPGTRRNIARNLLADVDPCPARDCRYSGTYGQQAVMAAWCGAAFAIDYGTLGAFITTGGGHGDYFGNEVYVFALDTLRWTRINEPYAGGRDSIVDYDEGEYAHGIPLSSHTYQHTQYLPPSLGGGRRGSLLLVVAYAAGNMAHGTGRAHACDLDTGIWTRYSVNKAKARLNATSATCFDSDRHVFWRVPEYGREIEYLSTADRMFSSIAIGSDGGNRFGVNHTCAWHPMLDLLLTLDWRRGAAATLWALDLKAPTRWRSIETSGPAPEAIAQGMGLDWCAELGCFVGYMGQGAPYVHKLFAPAAHPLDATWRWETESVGGVAPTGRKEGPRMNFGRFRHAPAARCFIWADDRSQPVQAWRLLGM